MSENQYEPKFVHDREDEADHQALRAAERLAENENRALIAPRSNAVFNPFGMALFYLHLDGRRARRLALRSHDAVV